MLSKETKKKRHCVEWAAICKVACVVLLISNLVLAGCSSEEKKTSKERLIVYDWSMTDQPEFHSKFLEKYPDIPPKITYLADEAEAYGKIKAGFSFDLVHPCSQFFELFAENGLIQPLDTSRIERWGDLAPSLVKLGNISGKQYIVFH